MRSRADLGLPAWALELCEVESEMRRAIIRLPFPSAQLFPNRKNGQHHAVTQRFKEADRESGYLLTKSQAGDFVAPDGDMALSLVFSQPDRRHRDLDNMLAASKALLDGMAKALGVDDKRFRPISIDSVRGEKPGALIVAVGYEVIQ